MICGAGLLYALLSPSLAAANNPDTSKDAPAADSQPKGKNNVEASAGDKMTAANDSVSGLENFNAYVTAKNIAIAIAITLVCLWISNFHKLITHRNKEGNAYLFVDKSLFIRDFLNAGDEITLITRPRRFGKTLTLSMLEHFLAPEVNEQSTKGLFEGLQISKYPNIMKDQGQYPSHA